MRLRPDPIHYAAVGPAIETTPHTLPAQQVFTQAELADRIAAHAARVAADLANLPPLLPHGTGHTKRAAKAAHGRTA